VPSWRGAIGNIFSGLGVILFVFGIPYLLSRPAQSRRERVGLMFFGLGSIMLFFIAVGALLPSRFADRGSGFWDSRGAHPPDRDRHVYPAIRLSSLR
jgi:hypothetical protein